PFELCSPHSSRTLHPLPPFPTPRSSDLGALLGGLAGFYGQRRLGPLSVDTIIMRFTDVVLCFPTFFLILTVVALLPPSIFNIMRSGEHTSELQSREKLVCRLLLGNKKYN